MMYLFYLCRKVLSVLWGSAAGNLYLVLWGARLKGLVRCFGVPVVVKFPGGILELGRNVCLRNSRISNIAGCYHPTTLGVRGKGILKLGDAVGISGSTIVAEQSVTLGDRVLVGVNCTICDTDFHSLDPAVRTDKVSHKTAPVVIEDDVWLGMNVTVLKGVTIGKGSVIAAGSVVSRDIPANSLAGGVPAKVIKHIELS